MDGGGFDEGGEGLAGMEAEVVAGLFGDEGGEGEAAVEDDAEEGAFGVDGHEGAGQMISGAGGSGIGGKEHDILGPDADVDVGGERIFGGGV